jgi:glutamyl-tRNA reductase
LDQNKDIEHPVLFSIGINHTTAPVEVREKVYLNEAETRKLLGELKDELGECMILSTCNRTEIYAVPRENSNDSTPNLEKIKQKLSNFKNAHDIIQNEHFYELSSADAAAHLFRVASSIDSMVVGDTQILHQLKEAYTLAQNTGSTGKILNKLCQKALQVGKRTKTETAIYEGAVSVSFAAVELAVKIFGELNDKSVLILGAGETAELTAESLIKKKAGNIFISNRTHEHAVELLGKLKRFSLLNGQIIDFDTISSTLNKFDIIISSTSSPDFILTHDDFKKTIKHRSGLPVLVIDIAVPRDIDPNVSKLSNIFLKNIDDLNAIVDANFEKRKEEIPEVHKIIEEELINFFSWYYNLQLVPTIKEIEEMFENIRTEEILKNTNGFSEHDKELVEQITKNIVHKILRTTVPHLNQVVSEEKIPDQSNRFNRLGLIRRLFGLELQKKADRI